MRIDVATPADVPEIAALLVETEAYYDNHVTVEPDHVRAALFEVRRSATVLLARHDGEVVGMASYTFHWPAAGASTSLFLKELFVRETARRRGVGRALMHEISRIAAGAGCARIEWTANRDEASAIAFYRALGVEPKAGKLFYRWNV